MPGTSLYEPVNEGSSYAPPKQTRPSNFWIHGALITTQVIFGAGSVVGKLGLASHTNPVFFALLREGMAGPILVLCACLSVKQWLPRCSDFSQFMLTGFALFANQLLFIVGLKLSTSTTASIWQPTQPIMTVCLAILAGQEKLSWSRSFGIIAAVSGAIFMIVFPKSLPGSIDVSGNIVGHACFFGNCLGTSIYIVYSKPLLKKYPSITVTAWSYMTASLAMVVAATAISTNANALKFVCTDCNGYAWNIPHNAIWALAYWVLLQSVGSYGLMTWANQYADASVTSVYTALQPLTSTSLTALLIAFNVAKNELGGYPGLNELGGVAIVFGLFLILRDSRSHNEDDYFDDEEANRAYYSKFPQLE